MTSAQHALFAIVKIIVAGDENDGYRFAVRDAAQLFAKFEAGHIGHVDVQEDQVVMVGLEQLQRGERILDTMGIELGTFEGRHHHVIADDIVIDGEHFDVGHGFGEIRFAAGQQEVQAVHRLSDGLEYRWCDPGGLDHDFREQRIEGRSKQCDSSAADVGGVGAHGPHALIKVGQMLQAGRG